jgi:hypothetical protein
MELDQDHVQWQALMLVMLSFQAAIRELVILDLRGIGYKDERWMELAYDHIQWWALVLVVLHLCILYLLNIK